jgi:hypothetical protein
VRDVWILGECSASDEARLRSFAGDALRELAADVSMPLHLAEEPRADLRPSTRGWMSAAGAHLVADALELGDLDLRHLVYHEAAHWVARGEYPALRGPFWQETWAVWFATRFAPPHTRRIPPLKASNNYTLGWLAGAALAGCQPSRELLEQLPRAKRLPMETLLQRFDAIADPRKSVRALAEHQHTRTANLARGA